LKVLDPFRDLYVTLGSAEELRETAYGILKRHLFDLAPLLPLKEERFGAALDQGRKRLPGLAEMLGRRVGAILKARQQILLCAKPYPGMRSDLEALVPKRFLEKIPFERLEHLQRYLKAMLIRAERAALNPLKDQEKMRQVLPFSQELQKRRSVAPVSPGALKWREEFRWLLEEFKVSVFAQELGTAQPTSVKRLREFLEQSS
jgi:ATP-dependent helicase HrpA